MKRLIALVLCLSLCLSLAACAPGEQENGDRLSVVCTIFVPYDFARTIGRDLVNVKMLIAPGAEVHSYDPTPGDLRDISSCDVFLWVGGESEIWARELLRDGGEGRKTLALMDCVDLLTEEVTPGMTSEEAPGTSDEYDEHVWTSPVNAREIALRIGEVFAEADPDHADVYRANARDLAGALEVLDGEFRAVTETAKRRELVFGDRFPLRYFVEEYGLGYEAAFPGCASETEPSAATVAALTDRVRAHGIPVVLKIELSSDRVARAICESTGAGLRTFYSCHNVSAEDFKNQETYLSLMYKNLATLREALN